MSTLTCIHGAFATPRQPLGIRSEEGVIWLEMGSDTISLNLTADQLDRLESAIAEVRKQLLLEGEMA